MIFLRNFFRFIFKSVKWLFIIIASFILLITIYVLIQTETPESFEKMSSQDKKTFQYLSKIYCVFEKEPEKVWDKNYLFHKEPLILMSKKNERGVHQSIYLINFSKLIDTSKYQKVSFPKEMKLNDVYVTRWFGFFETFKNWLINFSFVNIKNHSVLMFGVNSKQLIDKSVNLPFPYFMPHEAFHEYKQIRNGWLYDNLNKEKQGYSEYINNYPHNKEHYKLLKQEFNLLQNAVDQISNKDRVSKIMNEWINVREKRYTKWPELRKETNSETMEGTAKYIEVKLYEAGVYSVTSLRAKSNPKNRIIYNGQYKFNEIMDIINKKPSLAYILERDLSYDKGATLSLILDVIDPNWKNKIGKLDNGKMPTLYELIKKTIH